MSNKTKRNNHNEIPKRLEPTKEILKALFAKSGNQCAFPECQHEIYVGEKFVGQTCHIEDALPGNRWNPNRTNEENRREENLILMCYKHHKVTENIADYSVEALLYMRANHEYCIDKGITPTTLTVKGDGDVTMIRNKYTGGAQVEIDGSGKKLIVDMDIDGGKNQHLSNEDF